MWKIEMRATEMGWEEEGERDAAINTGQKDGVRWKPTTPQDIDSRKSKIHISWPWIGLEGQIFKSVPGWRES